MDVRALGNNAVLDAGMRDVSRAREHNRRRRLWLLLIPLAALCGWFWARLAEGGGFPIGLPELPEWLSQNLPLYVIVAILLTLIAGPMLFAGRSPHVAYQPNEIPISLDDVVGIAPVKEEVVRSLNLFLAHKTFRTTMGGTPRRAVLFEGPPGTGKTYMAKAMAHEAGVPFLFVSSSAFQSMYYGQTNRKIRSYFKALRTAARKEGGAIGFIEEIDAIGGARSGMRATSLGPRLGLESALGLQPALQVDRSGAAEGVSGVVNELLIQLQSFDQPTSSQRFRGWFIGKFNRLLPDRRQIPKPVPKPANILVIGATNRASDLDPALLRPGRFDRSIHFDLPNRGGRRQIIDYYLDRKSHVDELDDADRRDMLAGMTFGYTPVMIEHVLDEALVWAVRDARIEMSWDDVMQARLTEELGLKQPVEYTEGEKRTIATHEAGHATVAYLKGEGRKLEILSIIKRRDALGLLAHSDSEERYTRTRSEMDALLKIAFGGMAAEELWFGQASTGPAGDLAMATGMAAQMVGQCGMGSSLISFGAAEPSMFGGGTVDRVLADPQSRAEVDRMLDDAKAEVKELLAMHRPIVEALRDALIEREELGADEILEVCAAALDHAPEDEDDDDLAAAMSEAAATTLL